MHFVLYNPSFKQVVLYRHVFIHKAFSIDWVGDIVFAHLRISVGLCGLLVSIGDSTNFLLFRFHVPIFISSWTHWEYDCFSLLRALARADAPSSRIEFKTPQNRARPQNTPLKIFATVWASALLARWIRRNPYVRASQINWRSASSHLERAERAQRLQKIIILYIFGFGVGSKLASRTSPWRISAASVFVFDCAL